MILLTILGIVQAIVFIALMVDVILIIWELLGWQLGINSSGRAKKGLMISIGIFIGIFYIDSIIFDIFYVHIVHFPLILF